jgi:hypothetical protein
MYKAFLITRPKHDLLTNYLFHWSTQVVNEAVDKDFQILDLNGEKASKKNFTSYVERHQPALVFFNGHGSSKVICGHNDEILIEADRNDGLLSEAVVYARSCRAAEYLGRCCVQKRTRAFVGYYKDYFLCFSQSKISRPLEDKIAELFLDPSNLVVISLLKGNTVGGSVRRSQEAMRRNIRFMNSGSATPSQKDAAPYLWSNIKSQTVCGNKDVYL